MYEKLIKKYILSVFQPRDPSLTIVCKLLGIEESQLRIWLCNRKIQTVNETLTKPLSESQVCPLLFK